MQGQVDQEDSFSLHGCFESSTTLLSETQKSQVSLCPHEPLITPTPEADKLCAHSHPRHLILSLRLILTLSLPVL